MLSWPREIASAAGAELRSLFGKRRSVLVMVLLGLPVIYPTIISFLYIQRQAGERPALVVDRDNSALTRKLTLAIDATSDISVVGRPASLEEGFQALRRQEAELLVYLPDDTSTRIARGEQAHVKLWASTTNIYTYGLSYPALQDVVLATSNRIAAEHLVRRRGVAPSPAREKTPPIAADVRQAFIPTGTYGAFLVPGLLLVVMQQIVLVSLTFSVGWQREDGLLPPGHRAPFARMAGRGLVHHGFHLAGAALIVFGIFPLFGLPLLRPLWTFVVFGALALSFLPAAIVAAAIARDRYLAFQVLMFFSAPVFMMSGFSYPLEQMPSHIQAIAWIFPTTPALRLLRAATVTGATWSALRGTALALLVQTAAWTLVAIAVCRIGGRLGRRALPSLQEETP